MSEWPIVSLKNHANLITGYPFKSTNYTNNPNDIRLISGYNIMQGYLRWDTTNYWPVTQTDNLDKYWLQPNDVVLAMDRPWIETGLKYSWLKPSDLPCLLIQRTARFRGTETLDSIFLRYLISSPKFTSHIQNITTGTAVPHISPSGIMDFQFSLPPLPIQKRIGEILGRLDDKIELNRRINATLEEMAQRLYKHWFVDFGPFQDGEFVESELGLIPQGWSVGKVGDFGTIVTGKTPSTQIKENFGDEVLFIKIPDMRDNVFVIDTDMKLSTLGASSQQNKLLPKMTICVSCIATPGLVSLTSKESQTNQQINSIIPNDLTHATFIYCQMLGMAEEIRLRGSGGTATLNLNKQDFSNLQIIKPSNNILYAFHEKSSHWFTQILNNQYQSRHLVTIRDYLLPRLLSGELSVEETANVP